MGILQEESFYNFQHKTHQMISLGVCIVYIDKIYNFFYVLPFFRLSDSVVELISIYLISSFRHVDILWNNVQTGDFQNLKASSVYYRSCLKHI